MLSSKRLHRIALAIAGATSLVVILTFALGQIENEASGRGAEFKWSRLGQDRANDIVYWDRLGLSHVGWRSARAINRAIGEHSGMGNSFARSWVLASACGFIAIGAGATSYLIALVLVASASKRFAEHDAPSNGGRRSSLKSGFPPRRC